MNRKVYDFFNRTLPPSSIRQGGCYYLHIYHSTEIGPCFVKVITKKRLTPWRHKFASYEIRFKTYGDNRENFDTSIAYWRERKGAPLSATLHAIPPLELILLKGLYGVDKGGDK